MYFITTCPISFEVGLFLCVEITAIAAMWVNGFYGFVGSMGSVGSMGFVSSMGYVGFVSSVRLSIM